MEMEPGGPTIKKRKLGVEVIKDVTPAPTPAATESPDLKPPTTAERSQESPLGAEEDGGEALLDRISNLCDTVLGEIITLLSTKDGARTQVLSSRWRNLWRTAPFNLDCREHQETLVAAILFAHKGSGRRICLPAPHYKCQADAADAWLRNPGLDNLQELEFYSRINCPYPPLTPPPATFRFSSTLRVATFSQCNLGDHAAIDKLRFAQLRKLALLAVNISDHSVYNIIAVGCPVLASLLLDNCYHVGCLRINSPTLISIGIQTRLRELIIEDAPSLQSYPGSYVF
ncbi:unnamed protein product [Alopecurus aequalis]